jgi:hypothetical protein
MSHYSNNYETPLNNKWDAPTIVASFERRKDSDVTVTDGDRVEIRGGPLDGHRGTVFQAKRMISVQLENTTAPLVHAMKHEVELDFIEGRTYVDNEYCVILPSYTISQRNTTQPWGPPDTGGDVNRFVEMLADGLSTMDQPEVDSWITELHSRTRSFRSNLRNGHRPIRPPLHWWDPPSTVALFHGRKKEDLAVLDHDRVEILGGCWLGSRGTIFQANRFVGIRFYPGRHPCVYAVKHEVQLIGTEGCVLIDHENCRLISSLRPNDTNTLQPWVRRDVEDDVNRWVEELANGLAQMDQTRVNTVLTGLQCRIAHFRRVPHIETKMKPEDR